MLIRDRGTPGILIGRSAGRTESRPGFVELGGRVPVAREGPGGAGERTGPPRSGLLAARPQAQVEGPTELGTGERPHPQSAGLGPLQPGLDGWTQDGALARAAPAATDQDAQPRLSPDAGGVELLLQPAPGSLDPHAVQVQLWKGVGVGAPGHRLGLLFRELLPRLRESARTLTQYPWGAVSDLAGPFYQPSVPIRGFGLWEASREQNP